MGYRTSDGLLADREGLTARLRAHVQYLAGELSERSPFQYENHEQARLYIERIFAEAGYVIRHDTYEVAGRAYRNVVVEKSGRQSGNILVVGAHYDTVAGTPGADDNASGVATLLEVARLLRNLTHELTVRLIAFTLEEPPHFYSARMGSRVHAKKCRERGDRIAGMISLEMVGYYDTSEGSQYYPFPFMRRFFPNRGDFVAVAGNFRSRRLVRRVARLLSQTNRIPVVHIALPFVPGVGLSDNWSFWREGYPALMITDTAFFRNGNYHGPSDLPETLDYARMAALAEGLGHAVCRFDQV